MKKLMTGNEAIARGAYEYGCHFASGYPGTPSTEIIENIAQYEEVYAEWAPNEKVALEACCGASINGARALSTMKHVGMNVAADPLFTIAYEGSNGGLVVITADEPGMHSSQNEQDNRYYAQHAKVAMVEPSDSQECKDFLGEAFEISEKYDTPVIMKLTTRVCHSKGIVELGERVDPGMKEYVRNPKKYIMVPANSKVKHQEMVEKRIPALKEYSENTHLNKVEMNDTKIGIITSGASYMHAKEALGDTVSYLKIGFSFPLPEKKIRDFASKVDTLYIIEENEPFMETQIKAWGIPCIGKEVFSVRLEISPQIVRKAILGEEIPEPVEVDINVPQRPPALCAGCPHRGIFYAMQRYDEDSIFVTDIGCYTLGAAPPLNVGEVAICMGGGISVAVGMAKTNELAGRKKKVFGIIGDSTYFHSGLTGIVEAVYNKANLALVILDNRITAMTGHQNNPGMGKNLYGNVSAEIDIEGTLIALGVKPENVVTVDPYDLKVTRKAVKDAYESDELFVIITKQPCALIKEVRKERDGLYCEVDQDKCTGLRHCLKIGCPAISLHDDIVTIDKIQCNGCGLCMSVCGSQAIFEVDTR